MIPLHVHSNNTFLNGTIPVGDIITRCAEYEISSLALTDTNSMHGVIEFSKLAIEKNIKPIIGARIDSPSNEKEYVILLAKNNKGYSELCKIITSRKLNDDFSMKNLLKKKLGNLFILSPSIELLQDIEPANDFFVELIASTKEKRNNRNRYKFAIEKGFNVVVTNPVYFLNENDFLLHKTLSAIRLKTNIDNIKSEDLADE